ncbi:STAS domain-containing protein [Sphaerisporangium dianthi]|uniref:Anti-sigma factor antagonist n=1 Tax=Sphaerisporangium dianthi TaxID=1436120 RepID=A0ABV9CCD2_9ACTN
MNGRPGDDLSFTVDLGAPGEWAVVRIRGELDWNSAAMLTTMAEHLWDFLHDGCLVLDLAPMTFCDSTGLGTMIAVYKGCATRNVRFVLMSPPPSLCRLLSVTGLAAFFPVYDTLAEVLASRH